MIDRRSNERLQVDAHLADLESEIEAGARTVVRMEREASKVDDLVLSTPRQTDITSKLVSHVEELRETFEQQRLMVRELRKELKELRGRPRQP